MIFIYTTQIQHVFSNAPYNSQIKFTILYNSQIKCWFLGGGENRSSRKKTSRSRVENQQTQPTYDVESGNRTRDTLVEGERSHHCTNPAPLRMCALRESFHFIMPMMQVELEGQWLTPGQNCQVHSYNHSRCYPYLKPLFLCLFSLLHRQTR